MNQSTQLVDYINQDRLVDLVQSLFPGREWEDLGIEFKAFATAVVSDLNVIIKSHIDTLEIPDMGEQANGDVIPQTLGVTLARMIDEHCPHWNIAQKAVIFWNYYTELTKTAMRDFGNRMNDKYNRQQERQQQVQTKTRPDHEEEGEAILRNMFKEPE